MSTITGNLSAVNPPSPGISSLPSAQARCDSPSPCWPPNSPSGLGSQLAQRGHRQAAAAGGERRVGASIKSSGGRMRGASDGATRCASPGHCSRGSASHGHRRPDARAGSAVRSPRRGVSLQVHRRRFTFCRRSDVREVMEPETPCRAYDSSAPPHSPTGRYGTTEGFDRHAAAGVSVRAGNGSQNRRSAAARGPRP